MENFARGELDVVDGVVRTLARHVELVQSIHELFFFFRLVIGKFLQPVAMILEHTSTSSSKRLLWLDRLWINFLALGSRTASRPCSEAIVGDFARCGRKRHWWVVGGGFQVNHRHGFGEGKD